MIIMEKLQKILLGGYCNKEVFTVDDTAIWMNPDVLVIITTYAVREMACKLMENNVPPEKILFYPELLIDDIDIKIFRDNKQHIRKVYNSLDDYLSKYIYASIFDIYMTGDIGVLSRTKGNRQYFPLRGTSDFIEGFCLSEDESFVDCGAFDGDTIKEFRSLANNHYKKIWAFEPDPANFLKLSNYIENTGDERIHLFQRGIYNEDAVMSFSGSLGTSSTMDTSGSESIKVSQIDSIIKEPVTYIKMDIEGAEKEALMGARNIITKYKPKLAICIYHKVEDLWEIPLLIKNLNKDYKIYVRNYEDRIDETICYAV